MLKFKPLPDLGTSRANEMFAFAMNCMADANIFFQFRLKPSKARESTCR